MATSIASQLQAIRSIVKADTDPLKRPFTRPSILFDAKEAADIDLDTLFNLALSGIDMNKWVFSACRCIFDPKHD